MSDQPIDFTQRNIAIDILRAVTMCVMIFESVHQIKNLNIKTYRYMKKIIGLFLLIWAIGSAQVSAQSETNRLDSIMPVRGLAIAAPSAQVGSILEVRPRGTGSQSFQLVDSTGRLELCL